MTQLAFIGMGNMGRGMVKNLVQKGALHKPLIIHNRTQTRADELARKIGADKVSVAATLKETVEASETIFLCLANDQAVTSAVNEAARYSIKGKLFVDCSTVHPDTTTAVNKTLTDVGARFVAAPVFGVAPLAETGQLIFVLAGPQADVDAVKPYTTGVMGKAFIDFGDQAPRQATLMKLVGNSMVFQMVESLAEGHTLAEKTGLGSENLHRWVDMFFGERYAQYSNRMRAGEYATTAPLCTAQVALKDTSHMLKLAEQTGTKMKSVEIVADHFRDVIKNAEETNDPADLAGVYGAVRKESGLAFRV